MNNINLDEKNVMVMSTEFVNLINEVRKTNLLGARIKVAQQLERTDVRFEVYSDLLRAVETNNKRGRRLPFAVGMEDEIVSRMLADAKDVLNECDYNLVKSLVGRA